MYFEIEGGYGFTLIVNLHRGGVQLEAAMYGPHHLAEGPVDLTPEQARAVAAALIAAADEVENDQ